MLISPHVPLQCNWAYSSFFNTYFCLYVVKFITLFFYNLLLSTSVLWKYSPNLYKKCFEVLCFPIWSLIHLKHFLYVIWSKMKVKKWVDSLGLYVTCQRWDKWGPASVPYLWRESLFNALSQDFILLLTVSLASLI